MVSSHSSVDLSTVLWSTPGRNTSTGSYLRGQVWENTTSTCQFRSSSTRSTFSLTWGEGCSSGHQPYPMASR